MKFSHLFRIMGRVISCGSLALGLVAAAAAVASAQLSPLDPSGGDAIVIQRGGQTLRLDPVTGRLLDASAPAARALGAELLSQYGRSEMPTVVTQSNGTLSAILPDDFMEVAVLELLPDGTTRVDCVQGMPALDLLGTGRLASGAAASAKATPAPAATRLKASRSAAKHTIRAAAGR